MMHKHGGNTATVSKALLTQRVLLDVSVAYPTPSAVVSLVTVVPTGKMLVVGVHFFCVFLAIHTVSKPRTAWVSARSFRFRRHCVTSVNRISLCS